MTASEDRMAVLAGLAAAELGETNRAAAEAAVRDVLALPTPALDREDDLLWPAERMSRHLRNFDDLVDRVRKVQSLYGSGSWTRELPVHTLLRQAVLESRRAGGT